MNDLGLLLPQIANNLLLDGRIVVELIEWFCGCSPVQVDPSNHYAPAGVVHNAVYVRTPRFPVTCTEHRDVLAAARKPLGQRSRIMASPSTNVGRIEVSDVADAHYRLLAATNNARRATDRDAERRHRAGHHCPGA